MIWGTLALAFSACLTLSILNSSDWNTAEPQKNKMDQIFDGLTNSGAPGAALLVKKNGREVLKRYYGVRDLRTKKPIDSRTNFRIASCTKQFTAMAIMLLVRDGKLRYE